jgi:uncharacterized protein (DUF983 family)
MGGYSTLYDLGDKMSNQRTGIEDKRRERSFSRRALNGKLIVLEGNCPECGHKKLLENQWHKKCARCGTRIGGN